MSPRRQKWLESRVRNLVRETRELERLRVEVVALRAFQHMILSSATPRSIPDPTAEEMEADRVASEYLKSVAPGVIYGGGRTC